MKNKIGKDEEDRRSSSWSSNQVRGTQKHEIYAAAFSSDLFLPPANVVCEGYVFTCVCHSFCSQGGVPDQVPPDQVHPPWPGTPPGTRYTPPGPGTPPRTRYTPHLQDQVHLPPGPGTPPRTRYTPPTRYTPRTRYTPPEQSMLGDTVNVRAVRILLECNLVWLISTGSGGAWSPRTPGTATAICLCIHLKSKTEKRKTETCIAVVPRESWETRAKISWRQIVTYTTGSTGVSRAVVNLWANF